MNSFARMVVLALLKAVIDVEVINYHVVLRSRYMAEVVHCSLTLKPYYNYVLS